jgi:NTE family protein
LRDRGREKADEWLEANYGEIGKRSTVDIRDRYL